jgi:phage terminase large subunit-like protein
MPKSDETNPAAPGLFGRFAKAVRGDWRSRARPAQIPPEDFSVLLLLAGRGAGKTWAAASYVNEQAANGAVRRIALIGATANDTRYTMVEGESGIIAAARASGAAVEYEAGKGLITWPSGAIARCFSADTPDQLRGPEHDLAWCDEAAAWRRAEDTWSNLLLTMRIGTQPRIIITTTPRPVRLIRDLVARDGTDGIVVRRMSTYDNRTNLAPQFFAQLVRKFEGTRLARQELLAELLEDVPGALWSRDVLEATRVDAAPTHLQRIVIGVDPAGSSAEGADMTGIIACGIGADGEGYVLADLSRRGTPREWASAAIAAYHSLKADKIVIERNFGGEMAKATLLSVDPAVPVKEITSSRGKVLRAEPIGSIFEQRRAHIVGTLPELEDQMCSFTSDWDRARDGSPDRVDALTFALTELMLGAPVGKLFREEHLLIAGKPASLTKPPMAVFAVLGAPVDAAAEGAAVTALYVARPRPPDVPLVVLDWEITSPETALLNGIWLENVARRLSAWAGAVQALNYGIFAERSTVGSALLELGTAHRLAITDVTDAMKVLPVTVQDRAALAARFIGGGAVKLSPDAHDKTAAFNGVTRNHFIAHVCSYGSENATAGEFVGALCTAVLMTLADDVAVERQIASATAQAPHELHGPLGSVAAAGLPAREHVAGAAEQLAARVAAYEQALEQWQRDYQAELERQRKIGGNPNWSPPGGTLRGFRPKPQDPRSTLRWI